MATFADLAIGQTFDFRNPAGSLAGATFSARCTKVSARCYTYTHAGYASVKAPRSQGGYKVVQGATLKARVGTIRCQVFNVV